MARPIGTSPEWPLADPPGPEWFALTPACTARRALAGTDFDLAARSFVERVFSPE